MKNVFNSTMIAIMCFAAYGCNAGADYNFDHDACTFYTNAMAEAESRIVKDYGEFYNNIRGNDIDVAANKYKQHHIEMITYAYKIKLLTKREHDVMLRSVELTYSDIFHAYKQVNMLYELRIVRKGQYYAFKKRDREMHDIEKVAYKACRNWQ